MQIKSGIRRITVNDSQGRVSSEEFVDEIRNVKLVSASYEYNTDGRIINEIQYDGYGNRVEIIYSYDERGNITSEIEAEYINGSLTFRLVTEYFYDEQNRKIKEVKCCSGNENTTEYVYDANGNLSICIHTDQFGEKTGITYKYDSSGRLHTKTEYTPDGKIYSTTKLMYNEAGQCDAKAEFTRKGFTTETDYTFDSNGFKIQKKVRYSRNNEELYTTEHNFTNDSNGRRIYSKNINDDYAQAAYFYNEAVRLVITDYFNEKNGEQYLIRYTDFGVNNVVESRAEYVYASDGTLVLQKIHKIDGSTV